MKKLFKKIQNRVNLPWLMNNSQRLMEIELGQTFEHYRQAAEFTAGLIKKAGLDNCEIMEFPADGKTVFQDKRMPLVWNASVGKLTIVKSPELFDDPLVADYSRHPFHLMKGSVATPPEGLNVRIITEDQLFAGEEAENSLVMLNSLTRPRGEILKSALDLGAMGIISDYLVGRYDTPDAVQWVNGCTEGTHWHIQAGDRPFIGFSVSPRVGDKIRAAAGARELLALAECNGKRSEGILPLVTALLPGRQKKELWIFSHLYEPLIDDNSSGVVGSIEIARILKELSESGDIPPLEFSLRLVFAMEFYGYAAFADKMGGCLKDKCIGAINTDSMVADKFEVYLAPPGSPFFGNFLMEKMASEYDEEASPSLLQIIDKGKYADDTFLSDPTVGVPTLWSLKRTDWWHNSEQKINIISSSAFSGIVSFVGAWCGSVLTINEKSLPAFIEEASLYARRHLIKEGERIVNDYLSGNLRIVSDIESEICERMEYCFKMESERLMDFSDVCETPLIKNEVESLNGESKRLIVELTDKIKRLEPVEQKISNGKWLEYAASIFPARTTPGFPFDLVSVPRDEKRSLPEGMIYGPFARVFSNIDGRKSLRRLIREAEWEEGKTFKDSQIKKYVSGISYLGDYGYLDAEFKSFCSKEDIVLALRKAGVKEGDLLLIHSSLSAFGRIEGGAETAIDAILEAVGKSGTVLFPAFTSPYICFENSVNKNRRYRPYDKNDPSQIWVGKISQAFVKRPGVFRSAHITHSFAGAGPLAEECLKGHQENDPPACRRSPLGKLLEFKGKIIYFGSGLGSTTFLHFLEDEIALPYLKKALCVVKDGNGKKRMELIPNHLPGHRDFYASKTGDDKFFSKAFAKGLEITKTPLGLGWICALEAAQLYELGMKLLRDDPNILLCDNPECLFCSQNRA